jgi:hypothetical protein
MNDHRHRYYSGLGIYKDPLKLKENETSRVASVPAQDDTNFSQITPDSPKNAREDTPYPSPTESSSSSSGKDYLTPRNQDYPKNISRSPSPTPSLAEIALAMELDEKKDSSVSVQKFFIPKNLGQEK